jgi:uncharacterized membrane-anchored protein
MAQHSQLPEGVSLDDLPVVESGEYTEADERLVQQFTEIETSTIDRLSDGGKRLVEWGTAALGIFFASLALLENPSVLSAFRETRATVLGIVSVAGYLLAILCGFFASIPMRYRYNPDDLSLMEEQLQKAFNTKYWLLVAGSTLFVFASLALGSVIISILLSL